MWGTEKRTIKAAKNTTPVNVSFMINPYSQLLCWTKRKASPCDSRLSDVTSRHGSLWNPRMIITSICLRATPELVFSSTSAVCKTKWLTCSSIYVYHDLKNRHALTFVLWLDIICVYMNILTKLVGWVKDWKSLDCELDSRKKQLKYNRVLMLCNFFSLHNSLICGIV